MESKEQRHGATEGRIESPQGADQRSRDEQIRAVVQGLRVVVRSIQEHSRWVERRCGVSAAQLWAMWELHARPGMRVSELSQALCIHQSTASNLLDKLENKKMVQRERRGPDHRVVRLYLTPQGAELVARAPRPAQGALTSALQKLPDRTLLELEGNIADLVRAMNVRDASAALQPLSDG
ncbi:MAG: winged helix-turn-helix transcriptional regulator [Gammaproteobacteria bacterium]|nr:winged helix-turn-helix transcriptional regulator [Gammaproteobacteria bacterium]NIT63396.1 winged helix-turn-helix transcriptional regulator [Gammaproteobacteria bacterium]NIX10203.1 MarR family transcriptional regulator [Gammaproteobacteria bacterium]NIY31976.1 MarR family transcriptional regulator [Gammaproteobacteria bacterium]